MKKTWILSAALYASAIGLPAQSAPQDLIDATNPEDILNIAKGFGKAGLEKDKDEDPYIAGRMEGNKYGIWFYGCEAQKGCDAIQFVSIWETKGKLPLEFVNRWHKEKRYIKIHIPDHADSLVATMDVNLERGGMTQGNLEEYFQIWMTAVRDIKELIIDEEKKLTGDRKK